jgi:hypothetical protein
MNTTDTAVARVTAYVQAASLQVRETTAGLATSFEIAGTWSPVTREVHNLLLVDLRDLLDRLADVCPDHGSCSRCKTILCEPCGLGEYADCGHQAASDLCNDCAIETCPDCHSLALVEARGDRRWAS